MDLWNAANVNRGCFECGQLTGGGTFSHVYKEKKKFLPSALVEEGMIFKSANMKYSFCCTLQVLCIADICNLLYRHRHT